VRQGLGLKPRNLYSKQNVAGKGSNEFVSISAELCRSVSHALIEAIIEGGSKVGRKLATEILRRSGRRIGLVSGAALLYLADREMISVLVLNRILIAKSIRRCQDRVPLSLQHF
jgi:hypothetical protein